MVVPAVVLAGSVAAVRLYTVARERDTQPPSMSIAGETIDYGPCAFVDDYHPGTVFSSIDHGGRYAYANQPLIARWNLARFAEGHGCRTAHPAHASVLCHAAGPCMSSPRGC